MPFLWSIRECTLRPTFTILFVLQVHFGTQLLGLTFSPNSSTTTTTDQPTPTTEGANLCDETTSVNDSDKSPLYFLILAPYPATYPFSPSWEGGPAVVPAAMVARDLINTREDILNDYTIHFLVNDSGCNIVSKAITNFINGSFYSGKNIVGIIGPSCSEATLAIASLITDKQLSLLQVAPTATSPNLANTTLFPNTFRPLVSSLGYVNFYLDLIKNKDYRTVGALYELKRIFYASLYSRFEHDLYSRFENKTDVRLTSFGLIDAQFPVSEIHSKIRIIFVFASTKFSHELLCYAFQKDIIYPKYQFIFSNRNASEFVSSIQIRLGGTTYSCSMENMTKAVYGVIFVDFSLIRNDKDNATVDTEISYSDYENMYSKTRECHLKSLGLTKAVVTHHHSNYFDATWALALSLNNSVPRLKERGMSLSDYRYKMPEITQIVREEMLKLSFEGMRGRVEFSETTHDGCNVTVFNIYQLLDIDGDYVYSVVGEYNPSWKEPFHFHPNAELLDQDSFDLNYMRPHVLLGVLIAVAAAFLFVVLLACHIASIYWRKTKAVKAASPRLNHLIFIGCYLSLFGAVEYTTASVFANVAEHHDVIFRVHCGILQWVGPMTYSLVFGTLGVKTLRIHLIFNKFNNILTGHLGDKTLILIALLPLAVDVIINIVLSSTNSGEFHLLKGHDLEVLASCQYGHETIWIIYAVFHKGLLAVIVFYLAIVTRRVPKQEFKQTKSINILIFSLLILNGILQPLCFIFQDEVFPWAVSISYLSFSLLSLGYVVLCILLLLLPPLIPPIKENCFKSITTTTTISTP